MLVITQTCLGCFISEMGGKKSHLKKHNMTVESSKEHCVGGARFKQSQKKNKFNTNALFLSSDFTDVHKNSVERKNMFLNVKYGNRSRGKFLCPEQ